jgi:Zn-finger nucleic acid-binding protein
MIQPKQYKLICPKCGYSKIVKPKSDVLNPIEEFPFCPKCKEKMDKKELSTFDNIKSIFK